MQQKEIQINSLEAPMLVDCNQKAVQRHQQLQTHRKGVTFSTWSEVPGKLLPSTPVFTGKETCGEDQRSIGYLLGKMLFQGS